MRAFASLLCLITTMLVGLPLAKGGESEHRTLPASTKNVVAQKGEEGQSQGPSPAKDVPLGGMTVEDLLLQKGAITMDEWIQIRAEKEYQVADQSRYL